MTEHADKLGIQQMAFEEPLPDWPTVKAHWIEAIKAERYAVQCERAAAELSDKRDEADRMARAARAVASQRMGIAQRLVSIYCHLQPVSGDPT